ncbi:polysaccharide deacetylase family protein [uncultured Roseibium sp.]|uniref:polysaccharide deacetylase family protein n=1 Tax=uncultured Roseibium sp. TaxID=1936171 RepID=UPI002628A8BC|nr:polysaccharide deacetylase family protein [uncultured Roseibium sp.]
MRFERPTGLMFHHFHGQDHPQTQGSINGNTFEAILEFISRKHRLLKAKDWLDRAKAGSLERNDVCVTFDDTLACQYDVALPVLEKHGLTGFWFVYSSILEGGLEPLEIFRYFRTTCFDSIDEFYERFFELAHELLLEAYHTSEHRFDHGSYLTHATYYSRSDRWFRYLRDNVLTSESYRSIVELMMKEARFSIDSARDKLWLTASQVKQLSHSDHVVGLHSHTHPTTLAELPAAEQKTEYKRNSDSLNAILGYRPDTVSHPCNSYNCETLEILKSLGVQIGFRANRLSVASRSELEYAREDHANILPLL